jgi:hypothetical protein
MSELEKELSEIFCKD